MNQNKTLSTTPLFVLFAIIGIVIVVTLITFRVSPLSSLSSTQGSTPVMTSSASPVTDITQTAAAIITSKAGIATTFFATTHTPVTPVYLPTGIYDDQRVKISAALLFIDAQNVWVDSATDIVLSYMRVRCNPIRIKESLN